MKRLKTLIEKRLGIAFGVFTGPEGSIPDHRLLLRVGWGEGRRLVNVEAGIAGRTFYFTRARRP